MAISTLLSFLVIFPSWTCVDAIISNSTFSKIVSGGALGSLASYERFSSSLQCAMICRIERQSEPLCEGYSYDPSTQTCELYTHSIHVSSNFGIQIYKHSSTSNSRFLETSAGGEQFFYHVNMMKRNYADASSYCESIGASMLQIDSLAEYDALRAFIDSFNGAIGDIIWLGASDIQSEGSWISERDQSLLDPALLRWSDGEPNNVGDEDCAVMYTPILRINDVPCSSTSIVICEVTPD